MKPSKKMSRFSENVISILRKIPHGRIATYGQIAILAGKPQGARGVSWILNSCSKPYKLPWHRVVGSKGKISFDRLSSNYIRQKNLLLREGIKFLDSGSIDLKKYQWRG
jgi:methylated-DNA-protein-cysteine methyltransferase related protein